MVYRRTHDLSELIDLLYIKEIRFPTQLEEAVALTPFATQMRYDYLPPETDQAPGFDHAMFMRWVRAAIEWAQAELAD